MRHLKRGRKFGRERDQRRALMKSLASSFFMLGRIKTTEAKAKELRPYAEKLISRAKNQNLANRRYLKELFPENTVKKLFEYGEIFREREGGYTRIVKLEQRSRDGARMAMIELVK